MQTTPNFNQSEHFERERVAKGPVAEKLDELCAELQTFVLYAGFEDAARRANEELKAMTTEETKDDVFKALGVLTSVATRKRADLVLAH